MTTTIDDLVRLRRQKEAEVAARNERHVARVLKEASEKKLEIESKAVYHTAIVEYMNGLPEMNRDIAKRGENGWQVRSIFQAFSTPLVFYAVYQMRVA